MTALAVAVLLFALVPRIILLSVNARCIGELRRRIRSICPRVLPSVVILTLGRSMNEAGSRDWNPGKPVELTRCRLASWELVASDSDALDLLRRRSIDLEFVNVPAVLRNLWLGMAIVTGRLTVNGL